jgi:CPA2 family monovalent cation:H+ antiporter-2
VEQAHLLVDLAVAAGVAFAGALIAAALRQPTILGFIVGGILIGPNTPGWVGDVTAVEELANVGVVLLMFAIGVHISLSDLRRVGLVALLGGTLQLAIVVGMGLGIGRLLGWGVLESAFFGAVMAISSGAVMSRLLGERGELGTNHGRIALAWSAMQDFGTIVLIVAFSALATGEDDVAIEVSWAVAKALIFLGLAIPIGSVVLPWLLERIAGLQNREVFILAVATLALGTAYAGTAFGLSLALGAFVAGVVVSESDLSHQVLGNIEPLRDIFAGLFFVSIGMFVDPGFIAGNLPLLLLAVAAIVLGKGLVIAGLVRIFKYPLRASLLVGAALAQAGEFSFLFARLGGDLDVVSDDVFNLMLAASAVSIVVTAPLLAAIDPLLLRLQRHGIAAETQPSDEDAEDAPREHVVVCGYGRVGQLITQALLETGSEVLVVEQDPLLLRRLQDKDIPTVVGYAELPAVLEQTHVEHARALVIATPDPIVTRRIVDFALEANPEIPIVVRTHSEAERRRLNDRGATAAVMGELELALEMTRFTLERLDIASADIEVQIDRLRDDRDSAGRRRVRQRAS